MEKDSAEFKKLLNDYIKHLGGNKGNGALGKWAWYHKTRREFIRKYEKGEVKEKWHGSE